MSEAENWLDGLADEYLAKAVAPVNPQVRLVECRYCQESELHWAKNSEDLWRLYDKENTLNDCIPYYESRGKVQHIYKKL